MRHPIILIVELKFVSQGNKWRMSVGVKDTVRSLSVVSNNPD